MNNDKKQNRRDFLISAGRKTLIGGLGLLSIGLGYKSLTADKSKTCEVNLPCRNCFKLGDCAEDKAVNMRKEIKENTQSKKGINNG